LKVPEQQIWPGTFPWQISPGGGQSMALPRLTPTLVSAVSAVFVS
jgi:hypothetical protein